MSGYMADPAGDGVAIVGIGCRFPGNAASPDSVWRLLIDEVDAVGEVPPDRWDAEAFHDPAPGTAGRIPTRRGAFLTDVAGFDAPFFGMSPAEAADADPQQRLALELAWEAVEDAGIVPATIRDSDAGVYMGVKFTDYDTVRARHGVAAAGPFTSTGSVEGLIANRVSHVLGLRGPSMAVNASCAGSLIAVHLACQAIRAGECELALAGGVQLNLVPETAVALAQLGVLSPAGRCRAFDAAADGYVRGEGGAVVALKPYRAARRDGDRVYAVLRASGTNNNGPNASLPASSAAGQRQLLDTVVRRAGVDPTSVDYVEAHGTGTAVGDPAELTALAALYGAGRAPARPLLIGSVKTNIGHLEAASGIAGLVKLALSLYHGMIPRSLHCTRPITDRAAPGVRVAAVRTPWPDPGPDRPRRGAVSAFGFGGSNAHAIVDAAPAPSAPGRSRSRVLLVLSARDPAAVRAAADRLADHLGRHPDLTLDDLALSAGRRTAFAARAALVVRSPAEAAARLRAVDVQPRPGPADGVAFVLTDPADGSELAGWLAAGRQLHHDEPVFARAVDEVTHAAAFDLHDPDPPPAAAIFAVRVGLAALLRHWGVREVAVTGSGAAADLAARHLTGRVTLAEACDELARLGATGTAGAAAPAAASGLTVHLGFAPDGAGEPAALVAGTDPGESLLALLAALYLRGVEPDFRALHPDGRIVSLPTYPFQRSRHWLPDPDGVAPAPAAPDVAAAPVPPEELPARVAAEVAGALGIGTVKPDATFESLGMGSLDATELRRRLEAGFGLRIPAAAVWGYPSVDQLAGYLRTLLPGPQPPAEPDEDEALIRLGERLLGPP